MERTPDGTILKKVNENLQRSGSGGTTKVTASVRSGTVTIAGVIQYEMQRTSMVKAAQSVPGVSRVVDQMTVAPRRTQ